MNDINNILFAMYVHTQEMICSGRREADDTIIVWLKKTIWDWYNRHNCEFSHHKKIFQYYGYEYIGNDYTSDGSGWYIKLLHKPDKYTLGL